MKNKTIDINQRIPIDILHTALVSKLNNNYSSEYILEQLKLEFDGENRLKKSLRIVNKTIQKNPLNEFLLANSCELQNAMKKKSDRNIIVIALLNCVFPFSFDLLRIFGRFLSVQESLNRELVKKSLSNIYGGNRSTENAIDSVVPMFIDAGFIKRPKAGVYQYNDKNTTISPISKEIYIQSFKINNQIELSQENLLKDPYFFFIM